MYSSNPWDTAEMNRAAGTAANIQPTLYGAPVTERFRIRNEYLRPLCFAMFYSLKNVHI